MTSLFTTRNEHAALSFKQLIGRGEDTDRGHSGRRRKVCTRINQFNQDSKKKGQNVESVTL